MSKYLVGNEPVQQVRQSVELNDGEGEFFSIDNDTRGIICGIMAEFERDETKTDYANSLAFDAFLRQQVMFYSLISKDGRLAHEAHEDSHVIEFINKRITGEDFSVLSSAILEDAGFMANDQLVGEIDLIKTLVCYGQEDEEEKEDDDEEEEVSVNQYAV